MEEMAKPAIDALKSGQLKFVPERFDKTYMHWLEGIRDWCISRQLWWGHRIPAYYCQDCGDVVVAKKLQLYARSAVRTISSRMKILWIPGFPPHCGHFPHWAGQIRQKNWITSTRPMYLSPDTISSSSGLFVWYSPVLSRPAQTHLTQY